MQEAALAIGEVVKWFRPGGLDSLIHFVTYKCNARCSHCFFLSELNKKSELSRDEIFRLIKSVGKLKGLLISGGEPFLRKDLAEIVIEYVSRCGVEVASIPTNGFNTTQIIDGAKVILDHCRNLNLTLSVSLDGLYELHDKQRNYPGGFTKATQTMQQLQDLKKRHQLLRLQVVTVMTPENINSLQSIAEYVKEEINPDLHWFEPMRAIETGDSFSNVSREELTRFLRANIIYYHKKSAGSSENIYSSRLLNSAITNFSLNNLQIALDNYFYKKPWPVRCVAGRKIAVLYPNGDVAACELRPHAANVRDFNYDLTKTLRAQVFKDETRNIANGACDCFHGCFIPPSVRYSPAAMARLVLQTSFKKEVSST
ncbi:MAG: radical SAM protein [Syntrophales bacterium]